MLQVRHTKLTARATTLRSVHCQHHHMHARGTRLNTHLSHHIRCAETHVTAKRHARQTQQRYLKSIHCLKLPLCEYDVSPQEFRKIVAGMQPGRRQMQRCGACQASTPSLSQTSPQIKSTGVEILIQSGHACVVRRRCCPSTASAEDARFRAGCCYLRGSDMPHSRVSCTLYPRHEILSSHSCCPSRTGQPRSGGRPC